MMTPQATSNRNSRSRNSLTSSEVRLIWIESLQWCANNAVYFLGLIGAATYDLAGSAFLVAGITLVRNLTTSAGNVIAGPIIDRVGPRKTALVTLWFSAAASLVIGLVPTTVVTLFFAAIFLGLSGGFINTCTHGFYGIAEQAICAFFLCEALSENRRPRSGNSKTPRLLAVIPGVEDVQSVRSDIEDLTLKQTEFGLDLTFGTLSVGLEMLCHRAVDALVTTRPVENSIVGHEKEISLLGAEPSYGHQSFSEHSLCRGVCPEQ